MKQITVGIHFMMDGFWQVVGNDEKENIVPYRPMFTTVSDRATGISIYAGGNFLEIRTRQGRKPPQKWPPSPEEKIHYFRSSRGVGGTSSWRLEKGNWTSEHLITTSADPREKGKRVRYHARLEKDLAHVEIVDEEGKIRVEIWRRLSTAGTGPLAGAWESNTPTERWQYLVTAGHYGVYREHVQRGDFPITGELNEAVTLLAFEGFSANAGAILVSTHSFDHWPMVSANQAGYEARKHETFRILSLKENELVMGFAADGSDSSRWTRSDI